MRKFILGDCMDKENGIPSYPDNYFDLAIVDPPYGINISKCKTIGRGRKSEKYVATKYISKKWDATAPNGKYFLQLSRVSKNILVFGYNYFTEFLPPCRGFIFWDKKIGDNNFSSGELIFSSFDAPAKLISLSIARGSNRISSNKNLAKHYTRIHPTQKPIDLYKWLLNKYANSGDLILDTHVGSASSLIACESMGFDYVGFEIDPDYYEAAKNRMAKGIQQVIF